MQNCAIEQLYNILNLFNSTEVNTFKLENINKALNILIETPWQELQKTQNEESEQQLAKECKKLEELLL